MRETFSQLLKFFGTIALTLFVMMAIVTIYIVAEYEPHLASSNKILNYKKEGIMLVDRNGNEIYSTMQRETSEPVSLEEVSDHFEHAVLVAEDKNYYEHDGFSIEGLARSVYLNVDEGRLAYGGSTISQQLMKNTLLSSERTFERKYKELILTLYAENKYSKEELLEMYINSVYFGEGAYGIKSAAETYFEITPDKLKPNQAAYLAGMLSSPARFNPYTSREAGEARARNVLEGMHEQGYLSVDEYEESLATELVFAPDVREEESSHAVHFALHVISELEKMYGDDVSNQGMKVVTTLDPDIQREATVAIQNQVMRVNGRGASNGAIVVMSADESEVLAMVGSVDWGDEEFGKYNMATAPRQVGSAFKPIVYSLAIEKGIISPSTILKDVPTSFDNPDHTEYKPRNYDRRYRGDVLVRYALANSLNVPAVEVMEKVGVSTVVEESESFGISTIQDASNYGYSLVLGTAEVPLVEMVNAYTVFANDGYRSETDVILSVEDKYGEKIYERGDEYEQVLSQETAYLITSFLSDERARQSAFGNAFSFPFEVALKTGTTEEFRDAWTIGYTPEYVVGVWVGNNDNREMYNAPGSLTAGPAFSSVTRYLAESYGIDEFDRPENIVSVPICRHNGLRASTAATSSAVMELFVEGREPSERCALRQPREEEAEEVATANVDAD